MIRLFGGSPTTMPMAELYTGLQSGVLDAAEAPVNALTDLNHGEVAKYYSFNAHTILPDFLVINLNVWESLTEEEQQALIEAGEQAREEQIKL